MSAQPVDHHFLDLDRSWRADDLPVLTWPKLELLDGSLLVTPWPGNRHQRIILALAMALQQDLSDHVVLPGGNLYGLDEDDVETLLIPDVLVFQADTYDDATARNNFSDVVLAVEVLSRSTAKRDKLLKPKEYWDRGVRAYWTVDLETFQIQVVFDRDENPEIEGVRRRWLEDQH